MKESGRYWTVWYFGAWQLCSQHQTAKAALRAAAKCERVGGNRHRIFFVREVPRLGKNSSGAR